MTETILGPGALLGETPRMFIGGDWGARGGAPPGGNPAPRQGFTSVPEATDEDVERAMAAARAAQRDWARRSVPERALVLEAVMDGITRHAEELAWIVVAEQGKTIVEARGEIEGTRAFFDVARS